MNRKLIFLAVLSAATPFTACKDKKADAGPEAAPVSTTDTTTATGNKPATVSEATPQGYALTTTPDTATLGKNGEALVKVKNLKGQPVTDPDGKVTGEELSYELEVTNKTAIGGSQVFINPNDFRLELDNGQKIAHEHYNALSVEPEATGTSTENKFVVPAGAKPVALHLFLNDTRVVIKVNPR